MNMSVSVAPLKNMEVINVRNGRRLGLLHSCEIEMESGRILSLSASAGAFFGIGGRERFRIPWEQVVRVGADAVLVDCEAESAAPPEKEPCIRW